MNDFLLTALTFPTLLWSVLFAFCILYWLLAATGLVGHDHAHVDGGDGHGFDLHGHGHGADGADGHGHDHGADSAGMLSRLGLDGVPLMVMLAVLSFTAWVVTYFVHLLVLSKLPEAARPLPNVLTAVGALIPAVMVTNMALRPIRPIFTRLNTEERRPVTGQVGIVTTPYVDERYGMASVDDGGAGLLLQVRLARPGEKITRGQRVMLLEHNPTDNTYFVTAEDRLNA